MMLFPFYRDIEEMTFLIVGGGAVAAEKLEKVRQFTDRILVIAPETVITDWEVIRRPFADEDLDLCDVCIVATDDRALNAHIAGLCNEKKLPVNVVDDRELCSFIFPSLIKRGDLTVSITTGGKSPLYARTLRREIEAIVPDHIEEILDRMHALRRYVPAMVPDQKDRKVLYGRILETLLADDNRTTDEEIQAMIQSVSRGTSFI